MKRPPPTHLPCVPLLPSPQATAAPYCTAHHPFLRFHRRVQVQPSPHPTLSVSIRSPLSLYNRWHGTPFLSPSPSEEDGGRTTHTRPSVEARRGGRRENGTMTFSSLPTRVTFLERETAARATRRKEKGAGAQACTVVPPVDGRVLRLIHHPPH
ncbi:hypothetical protein GQ55_6G122400 [Panicum hallii var. hallii]|uniref:Uncharacterized protein n=1 Tax=Panicum hallii var. hallii TaxID=1504633 RepID=A0A2T7D5W3_9POAL|nr:hypothetical protein GQ55_6G122400 [Panicum hallii var. hallii]